LEVRSFKYSNALAELHAEVKADKEKDALACLQKNHFDAEACNEETKEEVDDVVEEVKEMPVCTDMAGHYGGTGSIKLTVEATTVTGEYTDNAAQTLTGTVNNVTDDACYGTVSGPETTWDPDAKSTGFTYHKATEVLSFNDGPEWPKYKDGRNLTILPEIFAQQQECYSNAGGTDKIGVITGTILDLESKVPVVGMQVTYIDMQSGIPYHALTGIYGNYSVSVPQCSLFNVRLHKEGYADDDGEGACSDPLILYQATEVWNFAAVPALPEGEFRALMSFDPTGEETTDIDLHALVPGRVSVTIPRYAHLENAGPNATMTFNGSDVSITHEGVIGQKYDQFGGEHEAFWLQEGDKTTFPYVQWGSSGGEEEITSDTYGCSSSGWDFDDNPTTDDEAGYGYGTLTQVNAKSKSKAKAKSRSQLAAGMHGSQPSICNLKGLPEVISVSKILTKQYLLFADCYSCGKNNEGWKGAGDDSTAATSVSVESLKHFYRSKATVRIVKGSKQTYCRSISGARENTATPRWDVAVVRCDASTGDCDVHDVNTFIKGDNNYDLGLLRSDASSNEIAEEAVEARAATQVEAVEDPARSTAADIEAVPAEVVANATHATEDAEDPEHLACPVGSYQVGDINADIPGCGLTSCDARYAVNTVEECKATCEANEQCNSFTWAPVGGDRNHMDQSACTMYSAVAPTSTWGPNQIHCRITRPQDPSISCFGNNSYCGVPFGDCDGACTELTNTNICKFMGTTKPESAPDTQRKNSHREGITGGMIFKEATTCGDDAEPWYAEHQTGGQLITQHNVTLCLHTSWPTGDAEPTWGRGLLCDGVGQRLLDFQDKCASSGC